MARWFPALRSSGMEQKVSQAAKRSAQGARYLPAAGQPYAADWQVERSVRDGFEASTHVFKAIDTIATKASSLAIGVRLDDPEKGAWQDPMDRSLNRALNQRSNPDELAQQFRYRVSVLQCLSRGGVPIEVVLNRGGRVADLRILPVDRTRPIPADLSDSEQAREQWATMPDLARTAMESDRMIAAFEVLYQDGRRAYLPPFDAEKPESNSVLWIRKPHPTDPFLAITPMEAAGLAIDTSLYARLFNRNFMANDGRPGGIVAVSGQMDLEDAAELRSRFAGGVGTAGRVTVLEAEHVSFIDAATSPRDAQYVESMGLTKEEILIAFGVPESVMGNASGRTFDNADAEEEIFWRHTMKDHLAVQTAGWDQLAAAAGSDGATDELYVRHNLESVGVLQRELRSHSDRLAAELAAGSITLDEYLEGTGREPLNLPGSRMRWAAPGRIPIGEPDDVAAVQALSQVGQGIPADPAEEARLGAQQGARLAGRINGNLTAAREARQPPALTAASLTVDGEEKTARQVLEEWLDNDESGPVTVSENSEDEERHPFGERKAVDGDGDGLVHDSTPLERPATAAEMAGGASSAARHRPRSAAPMPQAAAIAAGAERVKQYLPEARAANLPTFSDSRSMTDETATSLASALWDTTFTTTKGDEVSAIVDGGFVTQSGEIDVRGVLYSGDEPIGEFHRRITIPAQGSGERPSVTHELLKIEEEWQGSGIAAEFNAHAMAFYLQAGIAQINVSAAGDNDEYVGGYTWASMGFDFANKDQFRYTNFGDLVDLFDFALTDDPGDGISLRTLLRGDADYTADVAERVSENYEYLSRHIDSMLDNDEDAAEVQARALHDFIDELIASGRRPSAYELSQLGRDLPHFTSRAGKGHTDTWIGRDLMGGSSWNGTFDLDWLAEYDVKDARATVARLNAAAMLAHLGSDDGPEAEEGATAAPQEPEAGAEPPSRTQEKSLQWRAADVAQRAGVRADPEDRPTLRAVSVARVRELEDFVADALEAMWAEQEAQVIGRLKGRKARQNTRHWKVADRPPVVTKALDPQYILSALSVEKLAREYGEGLALHVVTEAFADARTTLQAINLDIGIDTPLVRQAIAETVAQVLTVSEWRAGAIRDLILSTDENADADLAAILAEVTGTYAQRRAWAETAARDQTNAMVNRAGMAAARAAGVAVKEWLSSHDEKVRPTHRIADGQVREVDEAFVVGGFAMDFPADPRGLPATAAEVRGCRCSLLFGKPSLLATPQPWQVGDAAIPSAEELDAMFAQVAQGALTDGALAAVTAEPMIGYRLAARAAVDGVIGDELLVASAAPLTLLAAQAQGAQTDGDWLIIVEIAAGAAVLHAAGDTELILPPGARLEIVAVTDSAIRVRLI